MIVHGVEFSVVMFHGLCSGFYLDVRPRIGEIARYPLRTYLQLRRFDHPHWQSPESTESRSSKCWH